MALQYAIVNRVLSPTGQQLAVQWNNNATLTLVVFNPDAVPDPQKWTREPAAGNSALVSVQNPAQQADPNAAGDFVAAGAQPQLWNLNNAAPAPQGIRIEQVGGAFAGRVWAVANAVVDDPVTLVDDNNSVLKRWVVIQLE